MQVATGKSVLNGIAIGKLKLSKKASKVISEACGRPSGRGRRSSSNAQIVRTTAMFSRSASPPTL